MSSTCTETPSPRDPWLATIRLFVTLSCLGIAVAATHPNTALAQPKAVPSDVVLVLDNSGSMRKSDPWFLASEAITDFVNGLNDASRLAAVIFDEEPRIVLPLTAVSGSRANLVAKCLEKLDYRGRRSNLATAVERAVYHLRARGSTDAVKTVVILTDGRIDTGDPDRDRDLYAWLSNELVQSASADGIQFFGVAFTERADFSLIQRLAERTHGQYARAYDLPGLRTALARLAVQIAHPEDSREESLPPPRNLHSAPAPSADRPSPAKTQTPPNQGMSTGTILFGAIGLASLLLVGFLFAGRRRAGNNFGDITNASVIRPATLLDESGVTLHSRHELNQPLTIVGRGGVVPQQGAGYICIDRKTISRRHALITHQNGAFWIEDQGTPNGTFVNEKRLDSPTRLDDGDVLRFEKFTFTFRMISDEQTVVLGPSDEQEKTRLSSEELLAARILSIRSDSSVTGTGAN